MKTLSRLIQLCINAVNIMFVPCSHAPAWKCMKVISFIIFLCTALLFTAKNISAEEWYDFDSGPKGKTTRAPVQLEKYPLGGNTEQYLSPDQETKLWQQDETLFKPKEEDKVEVKKILQKDVKTIKLKNAVSSIGFKSGKVDIPDDYIAQLKSVLDKMKNRNNVRLHFIGHSDADKLSQELRTLYINNVGLSKYRAQTTAEYFQSELDLAPDSVSFDGVGDTQPIASNETEQGKRRNRRVDVQVWYDEITETAVEKEIIVPAEKLNRLKVCRQETVCKLTYKKGEARRARLQHLVKPLRTEAGQAGVPDTFVRQISETLKNLRDKRNVVIRFVGHTDNLPLSEAEKRIYGKHLNLSKARARYVSLEVQDRLSLSNNSISSSGKGLRLPVASNGSAKGRSLNRRIEVEFWYDDPFDDVTDAPQICPESASSETVTRTYEPIGGQIKAIRYKDGKPVITSGYSKRLSRVLKNIVDKANVRLSFVGYTNNERMDRRTAMVYGDDIGLSTSRARRAMEVVQKEMELTDEQVEFEGHGYVHSEDVASTGFIQFDDSRVEVRILYDELALLDDNENLTVERIDRESLTHNPYDLNLMRITVDGEPLYDPYKSSEDIQRCTDVALEAADIQFKFNNLETKPRLNITAWPKTIRYQDNIETNKQENKVEFKMYNNYRAFIDRAEVRLFEDKQSTQSEPFAIIPMGEDNHAEWSAAFDEVEGVVKRLSYLLRVYDSNGDFDETVSLPLWVVNELSELNKTSENTKVVTNNIIDDVNLDFDDIDTAHNIKAKDNKENALRLQSGYGRNHLKTQHIEVAGGTVTISGNSIPLGHNVWLAGNKIPVNKKGEFVSDELFPQGLHTIEVAVLDDEGNGELFLRDMGFAGNDWFYVAIGDITASIDDTSGPARLVTQDENEFNNEVNFTGRFAYYVEGTFSNNWQLTSSADTQEAPFDELFSNFLEKDPRALLRRLDPDLFYPSFGDDSTLEERAPTSGKLYVLLKRKNDYGILGNFTISYLDTTLAHIDRGLYGVKGHYESENYTSFGEQKLSVDGFAAEPGTVAGRDEFRGTGGSLYFLRHQDLLIGSDRLRIEVRDKDSGIVIAAKNLVPVIDYDLDYIQGRVLLTQALSSVAEDNLLVSDSSLSGNPVFLVSRYEYSPGFTEIDTLALGGRAHYWLSDKVKIGATLSSQKEDNNDDALNGVDVTLRKSASTWVRLEAAISEGSGAGALNSNDGGFSFDQLDDGLAEEKKSNAYRVEGSVKLDDLITDAKGNATFYLQEREAGFSAPGQLTATDVSQIGARYNTAINDKVKLDVKIDSRDQDKALKTETADVSASYQATNNWRVSAGARSDSREDNSPTVAATQKQGDRIDLAAELAYDPKQNWTTYGFAQGTVANSGNREDNHRVGAGGTYRPTDRLTLDGELSGGSLGTGVKAGTDYLVSDRTNVYTSYTFENERSDNGVSSNRGNWNTGIRSRFTDTTSIYGEERYTHGDVPTGLTHALGIDYTPTERWSLGFNIEAGLLEDKNTGAETERQALGLNLGYNYGAFVYSAAAEYRVDESESTDATGLNITNSKRTTWLLKNNIKYQINPDWRFIGKANFSDSNSSQGDLQSGKFTEVVMGYGYRPVNNDRLNVLAKYTYFYNVPFGDLANTDPLTGQVVGASSPIDFIQKSHIVSLDTIYDFTKRLSIGAKYAYRLGEVAQDRSNPDFFESRASLYILRADFHVSNRWDILLEGRVLDLPDAQDTRSGALVGVYRHIGNNLKLGVGYNFTDFSDDLTDLDFDSQGLFINLVGKI